MYFFQNASTLNQVAIKFYISSTDPYASCPSDPTLIIFGLSGHSHNMDRKEYCFKFKKLYSSTDECI